MTMRKTAGWLAGAAIVVFGLAALASRHRVPVAQPVPPPLPPQAQSASLAPAPVPSAQPGSTQPAALAAAEDPNSIPPLPADATSVPDADLLKLSAMVNLANAEERHINKESWGRAVPIAQRLAQGPCDCEQRNWLVQFVQMGNAALAGSEDDYYRLATVMQKTARNDQQLLRNPAFFKR